MALRIRNANRYIVTLLMGAIVIAGATYVIVKPQPKVAAAPLSQSVLCMPNNCQPIESNDSIQDVIVHNARGSAGEAWSIQENNTTTGDADRQVLEIANQENHSMREVSIGVYVTGDIYNAMPGNALQLSFVNRTCHTGDNPNWSIQVTNPSTNVLGTLANYNTASGSPTKAAADAFCNNNGTVSFNLSNYKSYFSTYSGGNSLMYTKITIRFNTYDATPTRDERNVRFQMRLNNLCGATTSCREYLALVQVNNGENRNVALSVRSPQQKRVTTSATEYNNNRSTYDLWSRTYDQKAMRVYMEFGLPCTVSTATSKPIYIYDINDGDSASPETHGWIGGRDISGIVLQYFDEVDNAWKTLPDHIYDSKYTGPDKIDIIAGGVALTSKTNPQPQTISSLNHYLYALDASTSPPNTSISKVIIPSDSDHATTIVSLQMQPYTKYRLAITPVASNNFIAAGLPGDQIYGLAGCDTYGLTPGVTGSDAIAAGMTAEFANTIKSDAGSSSAATGVQWYSYGFVVPSGQAVPSAPLTSDYSNSDSTHACGGLYRCEPMGSGTAPGISPGALVSLDTTRFSNTTGLSVGDRVCSYLAINPWIIPSAGDAWRASSVVCHPIVAQPKVHIWGNDLRVGSGFSTTANRASKAVGTITPKDGSWVEYAITAPGAVSLLASQSGAAIGSTAPQSAWSQLTFANTGVTTAACPDGFGCYTGSNNLGKIPDVRSGVTTLTYNGIPLDHNQGASSFSTSSIPSIISGANLGAFAQSASISTTGTITIDSNIIYNNNHASSDTIPQLILVAGNINIRSGVSRIDAWLVSTGTINTCSDATSPLTSVQCNTPLTINGPIMAQKLLLNRTYNDANQPDKAAETVNLRGDAYIWAHKLMQQNGSWQTVYSTELPPRY